MYHKNSHGKDLHDDFEHVKNKARETRDALSKTAAHATHKANALLNEGIKQARAKGEDLQEDVVEYVQANPIKTIGWSMLAGGIIALWLRNK